MDLFLLLECRLCIIHTIDTWKRLNSIIYFYQRTSTKKKEKNRMPNESIPKHTKLILLYSYIYMMFDWNVLSSIVYHNASTFIYGKTITSPINLDISWIATSHIWCDTHTRRSLTPSNSIFAPQQQLESNQLRIFFQFSSLCCVWMKIDPVKLMSSHWDK